MIDKLKIASVSSAVLFALSSFPVCAFDDFGGETDADYDDVRNTIGISTEYESKESAGERDTINPALDVTFKPFDDSDFYIGSKINVNSNTRNESRPKDFSTGVQLKIGNSFEFKGLGFHPSFTYKRNEGQESTDLSTEDLPYDFNEEFRFNPGFSYKWNENLGFSLKNKVSLVNRMASREAEVKGEEADNSVYTDYDFSSEFITTVKNKVQSLGLGVVWTKKYFPDWDKQAKVIEQTMQLRLYYKIKFDDITLAPYARYYVKAQNEYWEGQVTNSDVWRLGLSAKYALDKRNEISASYYIHEVEQEKTSLDEFGKYNSTVTTKHNMNIKYKYKF